MSNVDETLAERGSRYGEFSDVANLTAGLYGALCIRMQGRDEFEPYHIEAIHMICQKLARAVCGDPMYADNWHDIGGYAKLVENEINKVPAVQR